MVWKVKLEQIGDEVGVALPAEIVDRLHLAAGDEMVIVEVEDGIMLNRSGSPFGDAMEAYHHTADRYRNAMRELARGPDDGSQTD